VNKTPAAKTLMLGDVRPFYVQGPVLYWTVFNRNEFIQKLEHGTHEAKNYIAAIRPDYIYVDWGEVNRLSRTYGFDPALKPSSIQYLSSPDRFSVRRTAEWEPFLETPYGRVHASILYQVIAKEPKPASREKRVKKNKRH